MALDLVKNKGVKIYDDNGLLLKGAQGNTIIEFTNNSKDVSEFIRNR